jgi:hypothetical protein
MTPLTARDQEAIGRTDVTRSRKNRHTLGVPKKNQKEKKGWLQVYPRPFVKDIAAGILILTHCASGKMHKERNFGM